MEHLFSLQNSPKLPQLDDTNDALKSSEFTLHVLAKTNLGSYEYPGQLIFKPEIDNNSLTISAILHRNKRS